MLFVFPDSQIATFAAINIDGRLLENCVIEMLTLLGIDLGTYFFLNAYIFDQLLGFEPFLDPSFACFVSTAAYVKSRRGSAL
jgi:hypothetical protein